MNKAVYVKVFLDSCRKFAGLGGEATKEDQIKAEKDIKTLEKDFVLKENKLISSNKKNFSSITIRPKTINDNDEKNSIHIIRIFPKGPWQSGLMNLAELSKVNNVVAIGVNENIFDFKESTARGIKQVDSLLEKGVKPQNILLDGLCFAGACSSYVAKHFYDKGIILNLFSDRSFATTLKVTDNLMENKNLSNINHIAVRFLANPLERGMIMYKGLETEAGKAFKEMYLNNPDRVNYTVYRSANKDNDELVLYKNSIHMALKPHREILKKPLKKAIELIEKTNGSHNSSSDVSELVHKLKACLNEYKGIKEETDGKKTNLNLFHHAIKAIATKKDFVYGSSLLKEAVTRINVRHKLEKVYANDNRLGHDMGGRTLYSRGNHSLFYANDHLNKENVNPLLTSNNKITRYNGREINTQDSMYGNYINKIKSLNAQNSRGMDK